jgi:pimeloyl-ACP methyl ester carboxylesterase
MSKSGRAPVVLLHGLGRSSASLFLLARRLRTAGHQTVSPNNPSRRLDVRACAAHLAPQIAAVQDRAGSEIAFVTHSMGALVARALLAGHGVRARAVVMLAPPNGGSEVADHLRRYRLARALLGPALEDLCTTRAGNLPVPDCRVGIIAGTRSYVPLTSRALGRQNDGLVAVERTRLPGAECVVFDVGHTFLMNDRAVAAATIAFLKDGCFPEGARSALAM